MSPVTVEQKSKTRKPHLLLQAEKDTLMTYLTSSAKTALFLGPVLPFGALGVVAGKTLFKVLMNGTNMYDDETTVKLEIQRLEKELKV